MGSFKSQNKEGVKEMQQNSRETTDLGSQMIEQADQINAIIKSIDLQDEEDIQAKGKTETEYQHGFDNAYSEQVESAGKEIEQQGEQIRDTVTDELGNVHDGIKKMEQAAGVSEIGTGAAESGRSALEGSASEYEGIIADAEGVVDELMEQLESLKTNLGGIFG